ncbi:MAG TPA: Rne/Rng family ribonuclease [Methyloceanibacter sp.]|jgi:ribonuclease E|nr:Rne/Rng family ribonuclease [Methyloceanibacter sp.]
MASKMLIDAAHPEETRVVVVRGNRVEEFDYESASKKQLRGNIYLAKVTRVEPSLQAAFVDYGGNRHGFLAFTEIHPDYYQIPVADRQALLEEEAAEQSRASAEEAAEDDAAAGRRRRRGRRGRGRHDRPREGERTSAPAPESLQVARLEIDDEVDTTPQEEASSVVMEASDLVHEVSEPAERPEDAEGEVVEVETIERNAPDPEDDDDEAEHGEPVGQPVAVKEGNGEVVAETVESVGSEDALEEVPERVRRRRGRPYKIQEVIRRRQIILVQVVKEERGNKGAALTTYLSLAGRYTVLMPNTARGGGISRKITQPTDRKRLREIAGELEVPEGMGLIIRTAGAQRTKTEIKRDYDYLLRLWENVRDLTLKSTAPALVYEEGSLIKRSIRDLYNKDIDEVLVAGDDAYREAKDFMRMLMPSHAKNVKPYKEPEPIFIRYQVERQLAAMFSPQVVLKSGGYIVINQTEALVSIDVNSGKATREHNIEDTALKTNLEAAEEIARQLRLRDLAGLIVIDFIDMDERRNNRLVERRLKEALRNDRARIQVGRISHFGLLEMSRQRLRTGMLEGSTKPCPMCQGTGMVRSVESVALDILRSIEDRLITDGVVPLIATTAVDVALYILNQKRAHLNDIQMRYRIPITVTADENMHVSQFVIERAAEGEIANGGAAVVHMDWAHHHEPTPAGEAPQAPAPQAAAEGEGEQKHRSRRRRRRGRRSGGGAEEQRQAPSQAHARVDAREPEDEDEREESVGEEPKAEAKEQGAAQARKGPRRRGRRGGRRGRSGQRPQRAPGEEAPLELRSQAEDQAERGASEEDEAHQSGARRQRRPEEGPRTEIEQPRREAERVFETVSTAREKPSASGEVRVEGPATPEAPRRKGWWQR